jgi:hypothetical protein
VNPFETETMAELYVRQGHLEDALGIYRRLLERTPEAEARARIEGRTQTLASALAPLPVPGVRAQRTGDQLIIEWRLPSKTPAPALELLLVTRGDTGVAADRRAIDLQQPSGRIELRVPGLHSVRAAAGTRASGGFVPLARAPSP